MSFDWSKLTATVNNFGIVGFTGANGAGKTLAMVQTGLPRLEAGRTVLSTVRVLDYENPRPCDDDSCEFPGHPDHQAAHPNFRPLRGWEDVLAAVDCDIWFDEITGVASSRDSMNLPKPIVNLLMQLRRRNLMLRWTAPHWSRADGVIRQTTQLNVQCSGHVRRRAGGEWPRATWFKARAFDARDVDEMTEGKRDRIRPLRTSFAAIGNIDGRLAYETLDHVLALPMLAGGRCYICGGRQAVPSCGCDSHTLALAESGGLALDLR